MTKTSTKLGLLLTSLLFLQMIWMPVAETRAQFFESDGIATRFMKRVHQRSNSQVLGAFQSVVEKARQATVEFRRNDKTVAMGGIVDPSGLIVTKASLVNNVDEDAPLEVVLSNGDKYLGEDIVAIDKRNDLALVKIEASNLPVLQFASSYQPEVGSLLATAGLKDEPVAIGVCGLESHEVQMRRAMLGVLLSRDPGPATVETVVERSAAEIAGIKSQDVILAINNEDIADSVQLIETVGTFEPGDSLKVRLKREKKEMLLSVILGEWAAGPNQLRHDFQNHLGGDLSQRRSGFQSVFQHDSYLQPQQCGSPVVNLDGQVIGLNIARAGRVSTLAIPSDQLTASIERLKSAASLQLEDNLVQSRISAKPVISENGEEQPANDATWRPKSTTPQLVP